MITALKKITQRLLRKFSCAGQCFPDALPTKAEPGVYGHVSGYLGVVEPQMRKALHIHMLIQLLGFAHPADLFSDGRFADTFRRLWYFATSICFRSTEAFAAYTREDRAMETLQQEPLLPLRLSELLQAREGSLRSCLKKFLAALHH